MRTRIGGGDGDEALDALKTVRDWIRWTNSRLEDADLYFGHGTDEAWDEAVALVGGALRIPPDRLEPMLSARVTRAEGVILLGLLERRIEARVPVPYLVGRAWLAGVEFVVDERVIVPRSPIAGLLDEGLAPWLVTEPLRILDLCTGSGCLGLLAALAYPDAEVVLADLSADALEVAQTNVERLGLSDRVTLRQGDGPAALGPEVPFDLVICNPPYVNASDLATMPEEFASEPAMALAGGEDGLALISAWLPVLPAHMTDGAVLVLELGNSAPALGVRFPALSVSWPALETGGTGVLVITAEDLRTLTAG